MTETYRKSTGRRRATHASARGCVAFLCLPLFAGCGDGAWNDPWPAADHTANVLYSSFEERPKHLDPARSYSSNEYAFIGQIYEPPLQYHYLLRPYRLEPLTAQTMPVVRLLGRSGALLPPDTSPEAVDFTEYELRIRPGISYAPHPAFARAADGSYRYHALTARDLDGVHTLADFRETGTRELEAADYAWQIKRLANPAVHSPIAPIMQDYIVGFREFAQAAGRADGEAKGWQDLRAIPLAGVEVPDRYTLRVRLKGSYPQFLYWLAMPFFAPMPWEADRFYAQAGLEERNITLDWYPVGTGPYRLTENNPNLRMVLERNPEFRGEPYPAQGMPEDVAEGLLADAGKTMPFIDRVVFALEKEEIPYWTKFLQGYYDASGVSSDSFDQAIRFDAAGELGLTPGMEAQGIRLSSAVTASIYYMGFNWRDPVVGGSGERARWLRQAISIAVDYEEYIPIFTNGRAVAAQGPLAPGIFGHQEGRTGMNPVVYRWEEDKPRRRSIDEARALMAKAGYPDGVDTATGEVLTLNFDTAATGPDARAQLNWFRKQFEKLGIQLVVRATDYNRFQEKMRQGTAQVFQWGWNADYPDPENFLFLLYGPNAKVDGGENAANYANPRFDALFARMKDMPDGPERLRIIDEMVGLVREDAPWLFGMHTKSIALRHAWYRNVKPNLMAHNELKYRRVDPALRAERRAAWNQPVTWPLWAGLGALVLAVLPAWITVRRRARRSAR